MPTYNLPAINDDTPMPAPTNYGRWESATDLAGLSKALRLASATANIGQVKSIPDAWAQAQITGQGLTDPSHELHEDVVSQWRGLLALFALQPFFTDVYEIEIQPIALADHANGRRRLRRVLHDLLPFVSLAPGLKWEDAGVILIRDRSSGPFSQGDRVPIGQLSPWTFVSPGKLASEVRMADVPWLRNGLSDPIKSGGLSSDHFSALVRYLEQLSLALEREGCDRHDADLFAEMRTRIAEFGRACMARVVDPAVLRSRPLPLNWPAKFYAQLGGAWEIDEAGIPEGDSRTALKMRSELAALFKGVILIDPALTETFRRPAEAIRVWERSTLRDALSPSNLARIKSEASAKGYLVVQPEDFFATKLVKFNKDVDVPGHPPSLRNALLPISPLALMLLDRESLAGAISLSERGGEHVVELTLPLAIDEGRERITQHVLRQSFGEEDVLEEDIPEDLAVWPNFQSPDWRWTFLHFQYNTDLDIQTRFAFSAALLQKDVQAQGASAVDRARAMREWISPLGLAVDRRILAERLGETKDPDGEVMLRRIRFRDSPKAVGEMQQLPLGADAIFFARRAAGPQSERPVGCVLLRPAPVAAGHGVALVSIDFGTTNTVAYVQRAGNASVVTLQDRILFPIRSVHGDAERRRRLFAAYTDFFPLKAYETPLPTVVKRRGFRDGAPAGLLPIEAGGSDAHGFTDQIFFVPAYDQEESTGSILSWIASDDLIFEIKWREDAPLRMLIKRYLRQVMMMITAELLAGGVSPASIRWRFSYPQAFARREIDAFEHFIWQAWRDLFGDVAALRGADPQQYVVTRTEGEAALHYFTEDPEQAYAGAGDLMMMLDIGGGTTDIAVSYRGAIRWRSSFKLAGGDFFTRFLANNFNILRRIDFNQVASFVESDAGKNPKAAANFVELFVNAPNFTQNFERNYPAFEAEAEGRALRQCASVALGGLLYYMGLVLRQFAADGHLTDLSNLTITFGGRGSTLFRQLNRGGRDQSDLARICRLLVVAANPNLDPAAVRILPLFSRQPKHEVARGLLIDEPGDAGRQAKWTAAPLGEAVVVARNGAKETLSPQDSIDTLVDAQDITALDVTGLGDFLVALKQQTGIGIDLGAFRGKAAEIIRAGAIEPVRKQVKTAAADRADGADDRSAMEPPFITALKILVSLMSRPVAMRDEAVSVVDKSR
jgi:hypothetical protein